MDEAGEALEAAFSDFLDVVDDALQQMLDALEGDDGDGAGDLRKIVEDFKDDPMKDRGGVTLEDLAGWVQHYEPAGVVDLMRRNGYK